MQRLLWPCLRLTLCIPSCSCVKWIHSSQRSFFSPPASFLAFSIDYQLFFWLIYQWWMIMHNLDRSFYIIEPVIQQKSTPSLPLSSALLIDAIYVMKYSYAVVHTVHNVRICKYYKSSACSIWLLYITLFCTARECRPALKNDCKYTIYNAYTPKNTA